MKFTLLTISAPVALGSICGFRTEAQESERRSRIMQGLTVLHRTEAQIHKQVDDDLIYAQRLAAEDREEQRQRISALKRELILRVTGAEYVEAVGNP